MRSNTLSVTDGIRAENGILLNIVARQRFWQRSWNSEDFCAVVDIEKRLGVAPCILIQVQTILDMLSHSLTCRQDPHLCIIDTHQKEGPKSKQKKNI